MDVETEGSGTATREGSRRHARGRARGRGPGGGDGAPLRARWPLTRIVAVAGAALAAGVLLYPTAAAWSSDRVHATEVNGYVREAAAISPAERASMLDQARAYNEALPQGPLRDPYALGADGQQTAIGDGVETYNAMLEGTSGVMGRITVPAIDVELPIFHGTDPETLAKGVGHLFGSALPVGGEGTHAVLTAHSGFVNATLFTNLSRLEEGDTFSVTVLDERVTYQVDQILTVDPGDTDALRAAPGHDYLTLVTCTPIGVNSHRLLVRGERIAEEETGDRSDAFAGTVPSPGFPWWALGMAAAPLAAGALTRPRR